MHASYLKIKLQHTFSLKEISVLFKRKYWIINSIFSSKKIYSDFLWKAKQQVSKVELNSEIQKEFLKTENEGSKV